jgi:hypothetical protein
MNKHWCGITTVDNHQALCYTTRRKETTMARQSSNRSTRKQQSSISQLIKQMPNLLLALARLFTPSSRGVYPPHDDSLVVIGIPLASDADPDEVARRLWWRGLGLVERDGEIVAGADITASVYAHRVRQAHKFVSKQLRSAGVRGRIRRWELYEETKPKRQKKRMKRR